MNKPYFSAAILTACLLSSNTLFAENATDNQEDENILVVTAELEDTNVLELASSVTVIDSEIMARNNASHLSDVLNLAPNVNFASGAARGRFIQIRGIGERSEFTSPVNYSVGVVVDGIDLTGIAAAATTLDVQQIEILRGPQGTLYGANGLAGLINIVSNDPTTSFYSKLSAGFEEFGGSRKSLVVSNSISDSVAYRFAVGQYKTDGYMENIFLNKDDTNNIDETSLRGKLVFEANENLKLTTNFFYVDADSGYDAFSLDSNRTTYSDQPGYDRQKTKALSLTADWDLNHSKRIEAIVSFADSEIGYAFDEDWSYSDICSGLACDGWAYSSFDQYDRENKNESIDVRLHSNASDKENWVLGFYYRDQKVDLLRQYTFAASDFSSQFNTENTAIYGQYSYSLSEQFKLTSGLRIEKRSADYIDNDNVEFTPSENMWGGKLSLEYHYVKGKMLYGLISRGYKAGGINPSNAIPENERSFDAELMWNYEAGIKGNWLDNDLIMQASVFYQDRSDIQSKQSLILSNATGLPYSSLNPDINPCPCSFNDYITNADGGGSSYGVEVETRWQPSNNYELYSSLGILKTQFEDFESNSHMLATLNQPYDMDGRSFAHAPDYQAVFGINYYLNDNWTLNTQIEAKDSFFFSDRHEVKSEGYELLNMGLNYQQDNWAINLFVRNLTDEQIQTRGFGSFPNDPRNFYSVNGPYYQFAAPRLIGVSASVEFE
jgi:iron complex outermembrane recepter protein